MAKFDIKKTNSFKKSIKKLKNQKSKLQQIQIIIDKLANDEPLEIKYKDHQLTGDLQSFRECHIMPDLLLIYKKQKSLLILTCVDIGSHSELF